MCLSWLCVPLENTPHVQSPGATREHWESQSNGLSPGLAEWPHPSHPHKCTWMATQAQCTTDSLQLQDTARRLEHTSVLWKHGKVLVELPMALQSQRQGSQGSHSTSRSSLTRRLTQG